MKSDVGRPSTSSSEPTLNSAIFVRFMNIWQLWLTETLKELLPSDLKIFAVGMSALQAPVTSVVAG